MAEVDGDVVEGPLLVGGVHAHGDGDAGAERGEQQLVGRGTEVVATVGELLVGGDDVAAVGGLDGVGVAGEGVDGDFGHGGASGVRLRRGVEGVDGASPSLAAARPSPRVERDCGRCRRSVHGIGSASYSSGVVRLEAEEGG